MRQFSLKNARAAAGFTQAQIAEKLGVSRNTISFWENGQRNITKSHFIAFCAVTGFNEEEIFLPERSA